MLFGDCSRRVKERETTSRRSRVSRPAQGAALGRRWAVDLVQAFGSGHVCPAGWRRRSDPLVGNAVDLDPGRHRLAGHAWSKALSADRLIAAFGSTFPAVGNARHKRAFFSAPREGGSVQREPGGNNRQNCQHDSRGQVFMASTSACRLLVGASHTYCRAARRGAQSGLAQKHGSDSRSTLLWARSSPKLRSSSLHSIPRIAVPTPQTAVASSSLRGERWPSDGTTNAGPGISGSFLAFGLHGRRCGLSAGGPGAPIRPPGRRMRHRLCQRVGREPPGSDRGGCKSVQIAASCMAPGEAPDCHPLGCHGSSIGRGYCAKVVVSARSYW